MARRDKVQAPSIDPTSCEDPAGQGLLRLSQILLEIARTQTVKNERQEPSGRPLVETTLVNGEDGGPHA